MNNINEVKEEVKTGVVKEVETKVEEIIPDVSESEVSNEKKKETNNTKNNSVNYGAYDKKQIMEDLRKILLYWKLETFNLDNRNHETFNGDIIYEYKNGNLNLYTTKPNVVIGYKGRAMKELVKRIKTCENKTLAEEFKDVTVCEFKNYV